MKANILFVSFLLLSAKLFAVETTNQSRAHNQKTWIASQGWFTINTVASAFRNDGHADRNFNDPNVGSGFLFPKNSGRTVVFDAGVLWTAKLNDTLYVGGSQYESGLQPGKILSSGVAEDPALPKNRVYRVRPDYTTATLSDEARIEGISKAQIRSRYALDWNEWPASEGAPFQDKNNNGIYDPVIDIPGRPGADQTLWYVANDLDTLLPHPEQNRRRKAMGVELQVTVWGYNRGGVLGNVMFRQHRFVNKSLAPFDSMYVLQFSDADLGNSGDDFAGCDTTLHLSYVYNGVPLDAVYYPMPPPAVGYQFLNVPMISSHYEAGGYPIVFYPGISHQYAMNWNWLCQGRSPNGGAFFVHPYVAGPTRFWLDGDPVAGTGRLDGVISAQGDRRIGSSTGPFRLAPDETKDIVVASFAAMGSNYLSSITLLRDYAHSLRAMSDGIISSVPPKFDSFVSYPTATEATVQLVADGRATQAQSIEARLVQQNGLLVATTILFDDGVHGDGAVNDGIWGNSTTINREQAGLYVNATTIDTLLRSFSWERILDNVTISGSVHLINPRVFSDNINSNGIVNPGENVRYGFSISNATPFNHTGISLTSFETEFKVIQRPGVSAGGVDSMLYDPMDSLSYFAFTAPDSGVKSIPFTIADTNSNVWRDTIHFDVVPLPQPVQQSIVNHVAGISEWGFDINVVNPPSVLNHQYEITLADSIVVDTTIGFPDTSFSKVFTLRDMESGTFLLQRHPLPDAFGHSIPVTAGFKVVRGRNFDLVGLRQDSTMWNSPNPVWLTGDRFTRDRHAAFNGGATTGYQLRYYYYDNVLSSFDPYRSYSVEVRFDVGEPQKAYRLLRNGTYQLQDYVNVPFTVWDVTNRSAERQLAVAWSDNNNDGTWDPSYSFENRELVFIYNKTYNPAGGQFTTEPNNATVGANADIVYGLSLAVLPGHVLNESPGALYLRPMYALTSNDRFTFNPTIVLGAPENIPEAFELSQNYPNPFNPTTTIRYQLPAQSNVVITIFSILGQEVKTLVNEVRSAGVHTAVWDGVNNRGTQAATGVYFYRIEVTGVGNRSHSLAQVKKMLLLR